MVIDSIEPLNTNVRQQVYHLNTTSGVLSEAYMLKSVQVTNVVAKYQDGRFIALAPKSCLERRSNFSGVVLDLVSVQQVPHLMIRHDYDPLQGCWMNEILKKYMTFLA